MVLRTSFHLPVRRSELWTLYSDTRYTDTDLYECNLEKSDLRGAILDGLDFKSIDFKGAKLDASPAVQFTRSYGAIIDT